MKQLMENFIFLSAVIQASDIILADSDPYSQTISSM